MGVHGVGGVFGAIATGIFAAKAVNAARNDGLIFGNGRLLAAQALSVLTVVVLAFVMTWIILKIPDLTMGLRVSHEEEVEGLDLSQHGESGSLF